MRPLMLSTLALTLVALTACDWEIDDGSGVNDWENPFGPSISDGALRSRSTNFMRYEGIYVPDQSTGYGVAGMADMTCQLYVNDGYTGTDVDYDGSGIDKVDDGKPVDPTRPDYGVFVLGHGPSGLHIAEMPSGEIKHNYGINDVVGAKFDDDGGFYAVHEDGGDCVVEHHTSRDVVTEVEVADHFCSGDAAIDATPDGLVLADEHGSVLVDPRGSTEMALKVHTLTYSDHMHGYHLTTGETLTHVDDAGYTVWSTDLGGDVESHADLGRWQVASIRSDSTSSRLVVVDSESGEIASDQHVDRPAGQVYGSDDGRTVVVATDMASDAYSLR